MWESAPTELLALRTTEIATHVASGLYNGTYYPSGWSSKVGPHTPILTLSGSDFRTAEVRVGHGMSASHYITAIWVEDQLGRTHARLQLGARASPRVLPCC